MTKKKVFPVKKYEAATFQVQDTLLKTQASCMPTNLAEEKEKFLKNGKTPKFHIKDRSKVEQLALKTKNNIRFELFGEAQYILEKVRDAYGNGEYYLEHAFGPRITKEEATPILLKYIAENNVPESLKINWCENLTCSAKMVWCGPNVNSNRPELRKYSLWLNGSDENPYMRESGIRCLMDHEIGTHFYRSFNDGLQPWYADRERFGLRKLGTFEGQCTEEGLAAIHTVLRGRIRYLWGAAMGYYIACKSAEMTFKELFDHLGRFTSNPDYRWKQAMRVKRGLPNPNDLGGFGNDQCYFEGAVSILRRMEDIDFQLMMMGKVCHDELDRIKRVVRKDVVQYPNFMKNINAYKKSLRKILTLNGLDGLHPQKGPPDVYIKHLEEKKRGKTNHKGKKVRPKPSSVPKNLRCNSKVKIKGPSNKKKDDEELEEVKSFSCSHPFINMHSKDKPVSEIEKILHIESEGLKDVRELTGSISAKDNLLDMQLQKLQDIIKNHQWSNANVADCPLEEDILNSEKDIALPHISKDSELLSDVGEFNRCDSFINQGVETSSTEDSNVNSFTKFDPETCPETVMYTLCPSEDDTSCPSTPRGGFRYHDGRSIYFDRNNTDDPPTEAKENNDKDKNRSSSCSHSRPRLLQRSVQGTNRIQPQGRRQILHTPVADLSSYDIMLEQKLSKTDENNNSSMPCIKKRMSLKSPKTSETKIMYENEKIPLVPPSPPPPVNSFENVCRGMSVQSGLHNIHHLYDQSISQTKSFSNRRDKNIHQILNSSIRKDIGKQQNAPYSVADRLRSANCNRPMSTGSEKILELHWMDIPKSLKIAQQNRPLQPSVTSLLNVNAKPNDLARFKHATNSNPQIVRNSFQ